MKKFLLHLFAALPYRQAAFAYNANDVQQVQSGISCPRCGFKAARI